MYSLIVDKTPLYQRRVVPATGQQTSVVGSEGQSGNIRAVHRRVPVLGLVKKRFRLMLFNAFNIDYNNAYTYNYLNII